MFRKVAVAAAGLLVGASALAPIVAAAMPAGAQTTAGSVEICKSASPSSPLPVTGSFGFTISGIVGGNQTVSVAVGTCSPPIPVVSTNDQATITEASFPWLSVTAITQVNASPKYLVSSSLAGGSAVVSLSATTVSAVNFQNTIDPGWLEVCKATSTGDTLTGAYSFSISGAQGFTASASVPVGACSDPIQVPAGTVTVKEAGTNLYVTGITATRAGGSTNALVSANTTNGTATVTVVAGDVSKQTDLTYTNDTVTLKVCKVFDSRFGPAPSTATTYPFTFGTSGVAGPAGPTPGVSIAAGTCDNPVAYRPGTQVTITEGIVPGTKVGNIDPEGALSVLPGTLNLLNGTVTVLIGTPVTSVAAPGNEAVVTYTNRDADPGQLKICKTAGVPAPVATPNGLFTFTVAGVATPVLVPLGSCVIVPGNFPYGSTQTVSEMVTTGNAVQAISVLPTLLTQNGGATVTPVLVAPPVLTPVGTVAGSVMVRIGEDNTTEVTFTNVDPPVVVEGGGTTVAIPGGGTTTGANPVIASTVANGIVAATALAPTVQLQSLTSTIAAATKALTPQQRKALLKSDQKSLSKLQKQVTQLRHTMKHAKGKALKRDKSRLTGLLAREHVLAVQIKLLK